MPAKGAGAVKRAWPGLAPCLSLNAYLWHTQTVVDELVFL